jgi:hypothetical protein
VLADQAQKIATVTISPVEHRGHTEFSVNFQALTFFFVHLYTFSSTL